MEDKGPQKNGTEEASYSLHKAGTALFPANLAPNVNSDYTLQSVERLGNVEQLIMETLIYVLLFFLFNKTANTAERSRPRQVQALTCKTSSLRKH